MNAFKMESRGNCTAGSVNCLIVGGVGCLVVLVLAVVACLFLVYYAHDVVSSLIESYSDTQPATFPAVAMEAEAATALSARVEAFKADLAAGKPVEPITLTDEDVNVLIQTHPDLARIRDKARVAFQDGKITAQVSLPLDEMGLAGRYLNGAATFDVFIRDGMLFVMAKDIQVKDKPLPGYLMGELSKKNLAEDVKPTDPLGLIVGHLQAIRVGDGEVTLEPAQGIMAEKPVTDIQDSMESGTMEEPRTAAP